LCICFRKSPWDVIREVKNDLATTAEEYSMRLAAIQSYMQDGETAKADVAHKLRKQLEEKFKDMEGKLEDVLKSV
jgi:hypothetical protein